LTQYPLSLCFLYSFQHDPHAQRQNLHVEPNRYSRTSGVPPSPSTKVNIQGHVDFAWEVSRSLAACQGALLLVRPCESVPLMRATNSFVR
jgi:hypothetical protein